jgi:hypothetical protein
MTSVLVVDDVKVFPFPDTYEVVYARTLSDGLDHLFARKWDEIWLDHDLGGDDDIRPLVRLLEKRAFNGHPPSVGHVVICSFNPSGQHYIRTSLEKYYPVTICVTPEQILDRLGTVQGIKYY